METPPDTVCCSSHSLLGVGAAVAGTPDGMTTQPTGDGLQKDPEDWATGGEPATPSQLSYLETLATDTGAEVPSELTKAQASQLIDELREQSPRVTQSSAPSTPDA